MIRKMNVKLELIEHLQSWTLKPVQPNELGKCLSHIELLHQQNNFHRCDVTVAVFIIVARFLKKQGSMVNTTQFYLLIFVATIVALKMFEEEGSQWINMPLCSSIIGISTKELIRLESELLVSLDFDLFISTTEYDTFRDTYFESSSSSSILMNENRGNNDQDHKQNDG